MVITQFKQKYGPYALIAGGSDGLGYAFADALARCGLNLVLIARKEDRLKVSAARLEEKYKINVITITADMADSQKVVKEIEALSVSIGLLVYNAAFAPIGLFENVSDNELDKAVKVNVNGPLLLTKSISASMIQKKRGGIILMSSLAGTQGSPKISVYAATKSFNAILAEGLWKEMKPHGIDVIACCAGAVLTPRYKEASKTAKAPGAMEAEKVAEITLKVLGKRPIVVPGFINKIARFLFMRLLSRKAAVNIMSKNTGGLS